jgi:hypothetical protein
VAAFVIHKPFMAVTKYCDVVLEPSMREAGLNFYERGLNLATANLLTTVMPVFLNPRTCTDFLAAFVQVVRERTVVAFADFVRSAELVHSHLHHTSRDMAHWITPVLLLKRDEFFRTLGEHELDPLVPCYYHLADHWGEYLHETFEICADHSNVLIKERAWLLALASQEIAPVKQGFDRRTMTFPLKVASIEAVDSLTQRQIQLADVLAGVLSGALKSANRVIDGTFENQSLKQCIQNGIYLNGVWPNSEIDPQQLGTSEPPLPGQFDLPTYSMMVAQRHPVTQKPQA